MSQHWHVVNTFAGAEWAAHWGLLNRGYHSLLPALAVGVRRGRWPYGKVAPMFPGYIFVGLMPGQGVEKAETAPGFSSFLRYPDRRLITLSESAMEMLVGQADEALRKSLGERVEQYEWKVGDWVAVPYGPLMGQPVHIQDIDKSGNVTAYLGSLVVKFHASALQPAEKHGYSVPGRAAHA